jgi:hypothetical protein
MKRYAGESGLTLVELMMATAVTGLIVSFLGTSIYQMLTVTEYGNDRLTALHELQNAAYWFNLDGQRAVSASADGGLLLTISETTSITYSLAGNELHRGTGGGQMTLAQNITSADFSVDGRVITMSLTSAPEGRDNVSESGSYRVSLRPSGGP